VTPEKIKELDFFLALKKLIEAMLQADNDYQLFEGTLQLQCR
jgi:hypothetical protein